MDIELGEHLSLQLNKKRKELQSRIRGLSSASKILEMKQQLSGINDELEARREEAAHKVENLNQRKVLIGEGRKKLKESLKKFDKFVKDNDMKKHKAQTMAANDNEIKKNKEKELQILKEEKKLSVILKNKLQKDVAKYSKFQNFLKEVVDASDEFYETRDILMRHESMVASRQKSLSTKQDNQDKLAKLKSSLINFVKEKKDEILVLNNEFSDIKAKYDAIHDNLTSRQIYFDEVHLKREEQSLHVGQIKLSIQNAYDSVVRHSNKNAPSRATRDDDVEDELRKVQYYCEDLLNIIEENA